MRDCIRDIAIANYHAAYCSVADHTIADRCFSCKYLYGHKNVAETESKLMDSYCAAATAGSAGVVGLFNDSMNSYKAMAKLSMRVI